MGAVLESHQIALSRIQKGDESKSDRSQGDKSQFDKSHNVYIESFNRFMYSKTKHKEKTFLQGFSSEEILTKDQKVCIEINGNQATNIAEKGSDVQFTTYHGQLRVSFVFHVESDANFK